MAKQLYSIRAQPGNNRYVIAKINQDLDILQTYDIIRESSMKLVCTCHSRAQPCKHAILLRHVEREGALWAPVYWSMEPYGKEIEAVRPEDLDG